MSLDVTAVIYKTVLHGGLIQGGTWRAGKLMEEVVGRADELINCSSVGRIDKLARRRRGESG